MSDALSNQLDAPTPPTPNVSGGVDLQADQVNITGDVTGRDKIIQGDEVRGNKIVYNYQLDVPKLVETLRQALPDGDPLPAHLLETLKGFKYFHSRLYEWKELHNAVNDVIFVFDQFAREVERIDASGQAGDARALARLWRPVDQKVDLVLDFAASIKFIGAPLAKLADGSMQGPIWAIDLQTAAARIGELFKPGSFDEAAVYDATYAFSDVAQRHMYLADKQLRDTAAELANLSDVVLGSLGHDQI